MRLPTRYVMFTVVVAFDGSGKSSTLRPLDSTRYSVMPSTEVTLVIPRGNFGAPVDREATPAGASGWSPIAIGVTQHAKASSKEAIREVIGGSFRRDLKRKGRIMRPA